MRSPFRPLFKAAQRLWDHIVLAYETRLLPAGEIFLDVFVPERPEQPRWRRKPVKPDLERLEVRWVPTTVQCLGLWGTSQSANSITLTISDDASTLPVTVDYYTQDATATAGQDYVATRGTVTLPASPSGSAVGVTIPLLNDHVNNGSYELFNFFLINAVNATRNTGNAGVQIYPTGGATSVVPVFDPQPDPFQSWWLPAAPKAPDNISPKGSLDSGDVFSNVVLPDRAQVCGCQTVLSYNSAGTTPSPIVTSDLVTDQSKGLPTSIQARLNWNGGTGSWTTLGTSGHTAGDDYYFSLQPGTTPTGTGLYTYSVDVAVTYASGTTTVSYNGSTPVVLRDAARFGNGWGLGPQAAVVPVTGGVLMTYGNGGAHFFQSPTSGSTYISPATDTGTLVKNNDGSYTYTAKDGVQHRFDSSGNQTAIATPDGLTNTYSYDGSSRLSSVANPDGTLLTFSYDGNGRVSTAVGPGGLTATFGYDGSGNLTSVAEPDGGLRTFSYDAGHRLLTDQLGASLVTVTYDSTSHKATQFDRGGGTTMTLDAAQVRGFARSPVRHLVDAVGVTTDALGNKGTYGFDAPGRETRLATPDGGTQTWTRDAWGDVTVYTDALSRSTTYAYSGSGDLLIQTTPDGATTSYSYNSTFHELTGTVDPLGNRTTSTYSVTSDLLTQTDALNHTTTYAWSGGYEQSMTDPLNRTTTYVYDANNRLIATVDPLGNRTTQGYDAAGDVQTVTDPLGRTTTTSYDGLRRVVGVVTPAGAQTTYAYDARGLETGTTDPLGNQTVYAYDARVNEVSETDAYGTAQQRTTTMGYDVLDRMTSRTDALNRTTTYAYDAVGRQTAVTDPLGHKTTTVYDLAGQVVATVDPLGNRTTTAYDQAGRAVAVTDPLNHTSTTVYDTAGRAVATVDPLGNRTTTVYDAAGQAIATVDALNHRTTTAYDAAGQATSVTDPLNHRTTYGYDGAGRQTAVTDALGNTTTTAYDAAGEAVSVTDPLNRTTTTAYDLAGRVVATVDPLGNRTTTVYDAAGNTLATVDPLGNRTTTVYDALNRSVATVDALGERTTSSYDAADQLIAATDPLNHTTTYGYDAAGHKTVVTDALGNTTTTAYDADGRAAAVTDPLNHTTTTAYDAAGRSVSVTDALNHTTTAVYDAAGNTLATVDPLGNRTSYGYDALNREATRTNALGGVQTTAYDAAGRTVSVSDPLNHVTTYAYDAVGQRTAVTDALNNTTTTVYDAAGQSIATVDALNHRTTTAYDAAGRSVSVTDALNHTTTTVYDAAGNTLATVDPLGNRTSYGYDALNREATRTNALGGVQTTAYDAAGNTAAVTNERGFATYYSYDALNRQVAVNDPLQYLQTTVYDAAGNVLATVDQLGNATTYAYDAANRRVSVTDPAGGIQTTAYDADGNTVSTTDALNHATTYGYDALNRQVTQTDALNHTTTYGYDAAGNRTVVVDPDANRTTFAYDADNRQVTQTDPLNHVTTTTYDALSRVSSVIDPLGQTRQYGYDAAGHELTEQWISPAQQVVQTATFTYDANGNQLTAQNPNGSYTLSYDALDRVSVAQEPFGQTLTFGYDAVGNRTLVQDSQGGTTTSSYDVDNHLVTRELGGTGVTPLRFDYSYRADGKVSQEVRSSSLDGTATVGYTQYSYDAKGRLTNEQHQDGSHGALANYTYSYDAADRLSSKVENGTTFTYGYDATNQLTSDNGTAYSYDANGNRNMAGYQTGSANQTTSDGTWTYTYDADGQMVKKSKGSAAETWTYGYDYAGHMTWAEQRATDGGTLEQRAEYTYDAWGNRLSDVVKDGSLNVVSTQRFALDGWKTNLDASGQQSSPVGKENFDTWADLDSSNALVTRRIFGHGVDELQARESVGGTVGWYLTDSEGSVRIVMNAAGSPIDTITYDAWGKVRTESAPASGDRYKYTGREQDSATGLQYNRGRYYDPNTGKWTSEDPIQFAAGDNNLYRYVHNSPQWSDPSGLVEPTPDLQEPGWVTIREEWRHVGTRFETKWIETGRESIAKGLSGFVIHVYYDEMRHERQIWDLMALQRRDPVIARALQDEINNLDAQAQQLRHDAHVKKVQGITLELSGAALTHLGVHLEELFLGGLCLGPYGLVVQGVVIGLLAGGSAMEHMGRGLQEEAERLKEQAKTVEAQRDEIKKKLADENGRRQRRWIKKQRWEGIWDPTKNKWQENAWTDWVPTGRKVFVEYPSEPPYFGWDKIGLFLNPKLLKAGPPPARREWVEFFPAKPIGGGQDK